MDDRDTGEIGDGRCSADLGRANGYPERILAIVTKENICIKASDLHQAWDCFDHSFRRNDGWENVEKKNSWFWELSQGEWEWGHIEAVVKDK